MKRLNVAKKDACMACKECEVACSEAFYKEYSKNMYSHWCGKRSGDSETGSMCTVRQMCEGLSEGAITQNAKGVYMINKKKCVSCGKCAEACPFGVIVWHEGSEYASKCIACGICAKNCPMDVLEIKEA